MCNEPIAIISPKTQMFKGRRFSKNSNGYYGGSTGRLHRAVWEHHNGPIPKGFEIHHIDENKDNNGIENLELMERSAHRRLHASTERHKEQARQAGIKGNQAARKWHSTPEGHEWHKRQVIRIQTYKIDKACEACGGSYKGFASPRYRACSKRCWHKLYRIERKARLTKV